MTNARMLVIPKSVATKLIDACHVAGVRFMLSDQDVLMLAAMDFKRACEESEHLLYQDDGKQVPR